MLFYYPTSQTFKPYSSDYLPEEIIMITNIGNATKPSIYQDKEFMYDKEEKGGEGRFVIYATNLRHTFTDIFFSNHMAPYLAGQISPVEMEKVKITFWGKNKEKVTLSHVFAGEVKYKDGYLRRIAEQQTPWKRMEGYSMYSFLIHDGEGNFFVMDKYGFPVVKVKLPVKLGQAIHLLTSYNLERVSKEYIKLSGKNINYYLIRPYPYIAVQFTNETPILQAIKDMDRIIQNYEKMDQMEVEKRVRAGEKHVKFFQELLSNFPDKNLDIHQAIMLGACTEGVKKFQKKWLGEKDSILTDRLREHPGLAEMLGCEYFRQVLLKLILR